MQVSSLDDTTLLDTLRQTEIRRRQEYHDELLMLAEIDAPGIATRRGCHIGIGALVREMVNLGPGEARRMVAHAEVLCGSTAPSGARIDPRRLRLRSRWRREPSTRALVRPASAEAMPSATSSVSPRNARKPPPRPVSRSPYWSV